MKRIIPIITLLATAFSVNAQVRERNRHRDSMMSRWVIDVNLLGGMLTEDITSASATPNYTNAVNVNTGTMKFDRGWTAGADAQLGFFWGKKRHFGIGTGLMYLRQQGNASLDQFHIEYQATDKWGNPYRQVLSAASNVWETHTVDNLNIPIVLKYKNRFSKHWGFTADAGVLINVMMRNNYKSNGALNYEAIYQFTESADGAVTWHYDPNPTPSTQDWFITREQFFKNNPEGNVQNYFNSLREQGYNVGLGVRPNNNSGTVSYTTGSVGFMVQPSVNYFLSDRVALNLGVYYIYQMFNHTSMNGYRISDGPGQYNSVLNNVTTSNNQTYGLNLGARFFVFQARDRDKDGVPDKKDKCPDVPGLARFDGCPDRDNDGIPDSQDSCVTIPGLAQFHGCPDTDGDGIPDKEDACPTIPGPRELNGCPDRDKDGIPDKDDACPDQPGLIQYHGCPDTDGDGLPDNEDRCPNVAGPISNQGCPVETPKSHETELSDTINMFSPIHFEINKVIIHRSSYPILDDAIKRMKEDKELIVVVDGHTDITGTHAYNKQLSFRRAKAVKDRLVNMGANPRRIQIQGHSYDTPAADNSTPEGRAINRRAVMRLKIEY